MNNDEQIPAEFQKPPKTVTEMGIHLFYMSKNMSEMKKMLTTLASSYVCKDDLSAAINNRRTDQEAMKKEIDEDIESVSQRLKVLEDTWDKFRNKIVLYVMTGLVLMVLAYYGIEQYFK